MLISKIIYNYCFYINTYFIYEYIFIAIIRDSFLKALSHKQPNMETLRITLSTLVQYTDELLKDNRQLRSKTSKDVCICITLQIKIFY